MKCDFIRDKESAILIDIFNKQYLLLINLNLVPKLIICK